MSFDGDGREHGLVMGAFYRLLRCNFSYWPPENSTEDELLDFGIAEQLQLPFRNLIRLVKGNSSAGLDQRQVIIPPNLNSLTGFRGLLLHRKYLRSSAHSAEEVNVDDPASVTTSVDSGAGPSQVTSSYDYQFDPSTVVRNYGVPGSSSSSNPPVPEHGYYIDNSQCPMPPQCAVPNVVYSSAQRVDEMYSSEVNTMNSEHDGTAPDGPTFGDAKADALLLSRLISVFFWPGVMSSVG